MTVLKLYPNLASYAHGGDVNGQERAEENFQAFERWVRGKSDSDFCEMAGQGLSLIHI